MEILIFIEKEDCRNIEAWRRWGRPDCHGLEYVSRLVSFNHVVFFQTTNIFHFKLTKGGNIWFAKSKATA